MKRFFLLLLVVLAPSGGWAQQPKPKPKTNPSATTGNQVAKPTTTRKNPPTTASKPSTPTPALKTVSAKTKLIVTAMGAKVHFSPDPTSAQLARLSFGQFVEAKSRSEQKKKVGNLEDYWYQIPYGNNKTGWIFGGHVRNYDEENREMVITEIMRPRMRGGAKTYAEEVAFFDFLAVAANETQNIDVKAELELAHLVVVKRILRLIPMEARDKQPYKSWLTTNEKLLVYSEPTQAYYLRFDLLWDLETRYRDIPFAERIAYEAAITELAGECEGYLTCNLGRLNMREGRYLERYPQGVYVNDMMSKIEIAVTQMMSNLSEYRIAEEDKKDLRTEIGFLREAVEAIEKPQRETILVGLNAMEEKFLK